MTTGDCDVTGAVANVEVLLEADPGLAAEDHEKLARQLRKELLELDVESVTLCPGDAEVFGAKVADPVTIGAVIVAMSASGGVFTSLIGALHQWLSRSAKTLKISVTVEGDTIELDKASPEQQQRLVDAFIRRHSQYVGA
jgi:hypothetical protein